MNKKLELKYIDKFIELNRSYIKRDYDGDISILDNESYHIECDVLIKNFIYELGYKDLLMYYKEAEDYFWYS